MTNDFDVGRYLARIGYDGPGQPTLAALNALTRAHAQAVPFENIDVLEGRPIRLETAALYEKIVLRHRGGYCFELNGLFLELLAKLGFQVRPLGARVRLSTPDRRVAARRTHLLIEVSIDAEKWLTDVGVGAASLTAALRLEVDAEQTTPHDTRRIVRDGARWFHQVRRPDSWEDVYEFTTDTMPLIDRTVANWYTSTHPKSNFRLGLIAAIATPDGGRVSLSGDRLTHHHANGHSATQILDTPAALAAALRDHFGIDLPAGPHPLTPQPIQYLR